MYYHLLDREEYIIPTEEFFIKICTQILIMLEKIKKVGILTLNGYFNYGNRLQAYATQQVIRSLGFNAHIIIIKDISSNKDKINRFKGKINRLRIKLFRASLKETYMKILNKIRGKIIFSMNRNIIEERVKIFRNFSKKYLSEICYYNTEESLKNLSNNYDFFITGSDQVWNPFWTNSLYFLDFANESKRIAYAPSFGISSLPYEYNNLYRNWLSGMKNISVREFTGSKIIYNLIGRDVVILIDPTLMLTKQQWLSISRRDIRKPENGYILIYFLGEKTKKINQKQIKKIVKFSNLEVVNIADLNNKERYKIGPDEFIDYINSASLVLTDSFHGVAFSILMGTPFIAFERIELRRDSRSMFSRIETLLKKFKLESRKTRNIKLDHQIFNCNFTHISPILEKERKKTINYLENAFNI